MKTVTIYTDGACSGNPGPGGWGAILEWNGVEKESSDLVRDIRTASLTRTDLPAKCVCEDFGPG